MSLTWIATITIFSIFSGYAFARTPELLPKDEFQVQRDGRSRLLRVFDHATDRAFDFKFNDEGRMESQLVRDTTGKAIRRLTIKDRQVVEESFQRGAVERCVTAPFGGRSRLSCSSSSAMPWDDVVADSNKMVACAALETMEKTRDQVEDLFESFNKFRLIDRGNYINSSGQRETGLGFNLVSVGCEKYAVSNPDLSDPNKHSGIKGLAEDATKTIKKGLACLIDRSSKDAIGHGSWAREAAIRLTAYLTPGFSRPIRIACLADNEAVRSYGSSIKLMAGYPAAATDNQASLSFPSMALSLRRSNELGLRPEASLFHELLHIVGYSHDGGPDVAYLASMCCFENGEGALRDSCELMRTSPQWTSEAYLVPWSRVMVRQRGQYGIAMNAFYNVFRADPTDGAGVLAGVQSFVKSLRRKDEDERKRGFPLAAIAVARAAFERIPDNDPRLAAYARFRKELGERFYPDADTAMLTKRNFADLAGGILGVASSGMVDSDFSALVARLASERARICPMLSGGEKQQLNQFGIETAPALSSRIKVLQEHRMSWIAICP